MDKTELKMRLKAQRIASQKPTGSAAEKKNIGMSHEAQLEYQKEVWVKADRASNHVLRHIRSLCRASTLDAGKLDDEQLIDMVPEEQWNDICQKYQSYLDAGIEIVRPFAQTIDGAQVTKKSVVPSRRDEIFVEMKQAVADGDKKRQNKLMDEMAKLA